MNVSEKFRTFRPDYPGRIFGKIRPSRKWNFQALSNTQYMPRIIGKIWGGLSGRAENREDSACAARSIAHRFLEKSGADYPATRNLVCPEVRSLQMWPQSIGKIRGGLSGLAGIREGARCATRSTGPGLLE